MPYRRNHAPVFVVAAALAVTATAGAKAQPYRWTPYDNALYGYHVEYPAALFGPPLVSPEGDGISLVGHDGLADLYIFGFENAYGDDPESLANRLASVEDIADVTYRRVAGEWIVLSGYLTNGDIFYQRFEFADDRSGGSAFRLSYPESRREPFDGVIGQIGRSLTPPRF